MRRYLIAYSGNTKSARYNKATRIFQKQNARRIADGTWIVESTEPTADKFIGSLPDAFFRCHVNIVLCRPLY